MSDLSELRRRFDQRFPGPCKNPRARSAPVPMAEVPRRRTRSCSPAAIQDLDLVRPVTSQDYAPDVEAETSYSSSSYWKDILRIFRKWFVGHQLGIPRAELKLELVYCVMCQRQLAIDGLQPRRYDSDDYESQEDATLLACGHVMGDDCFIRWRSSLREEERPLTCPYCRFDLEPDHCPRHTFRTNSSLERSHQCFWLLLQDIQPMGVKKTKLAEYCDDCRALRLNNVRADSDPEEEEDDEDNGMSPENLNQHNVAAFPPVYVPAVDPRSNPRGPRVPWSSRSDFNPEEYFGSLRDGDSGAGFDEGDDGEPLNEVPVRSYAITRAARVSLQELYGDDGVDSEEGYSSPRSIEDVHDDDNGDLPTLRSIDDNNTISSGPLSDDDSDDDHTAGPEINPHHRHESPQVTFGDSDAEENQRRLRSGEYDGVSVAEAEYDFGDDEFLESRHRSATPNRRLLELEDLPGPGVLGAQIDGMGSPVVFADVRVEIDLTAESDSDDNHGADEPAREVRVFIDLTADSDDEHDVDNHGVADPNPAFADDEDEDEISVSNDDAMSVDEEQEFDDDPDMMELDD